MLLNRKMGRRFMLAAAASVGLVASVGIAAAEKTKGAAIYTLPVEQQWISRIHKALNTAAERGERCGVGERSGGSGEAAAAEEAAAEEAAAERRLPPRGGCRRAEAAAERRLPPGGCCRPPSRHGCRAFWSI